jgi:pimeloyl-ACP methyl ester carboxylesterase
MQWETGDASGGVGGLGGVSAAVGYSNGLSGASNVFFQLPGSLVDGALINGGANALISNNRSSTVPGRYYFQVRNGTVVSSVALIDPVSQLINSSGDGVISDPYNPALASNRLTTRLGVSADGVSRLVIRFSVSVAGMATFSLVDQGGNALPSNPAENGALTDLQGLPLDAFRAISTVSNNGQKAFAVYTAPSAFVRQSNLTGDLTANNRQVFLKTVFSGGGSSLITPLLIVRPPVVLVHGIWASESSWNNFPLTSSVACEDSGHFYACRINYEWINDAKFAVIAPNIGQRIRNDIARFRAAKNVAAVQADAIAHSMGGDIIRTLPLCGTSFQDCTFQYKSPVNLGAGDIHELVTIGTPHLGTPLANQMIQYQNQACPFWQGTLASQFASYGHIITNGAVEDLQQNKPGGAIASISSSSPAFPMHYVVGVSSSNDESLVNNGLVKKVRKCNSNILPADIRTVFGSDSDLVVPVLSQRNNLTDSAIGTTSSTSVSGAGNVIHSSAVVWPGQTGFSSDELNSLPSGNSAQLPALGKAILLILDEGPFVH